PDSDERCKSPLWTISRLGLPNPYNSKAFEKLHSLLADCNRPDRSVPKTIGMVFRHGTPPTRGVSREWDCRARIIGAGADEAYALRSWRLSLSPTVLRPP